MGAEQFKSYGTGADSQQAFRSAVDQAAYDYGHAGYTGTLAEKREFVTIPDSFEAVKKRAVEDGEKLEGWIHKALLTAETPEQKAEAIAETLMAMDDERITDKWGPAGCVEVEPGKLYLFFGWASS